MSTWGLQLGAWPEGEGTRFRAWAPRPSQVEVRVLGERGGRWPLSPEGAGYRGGFAPGVRAGDDYVFVLDGERERPDPASRWQPYGVHRPSRVVDPQAFRWSDQGWTGRATNELVLYELHVGTFTTEGTFAAILPRLRYLRDLGVTAVELMPVAEFPGARNWGYDGVHPFAVQHTYGGPTGLKRLVDACHQEELAVVLDVVYNHLGPEGNYLGELGPYFTRRYRTPWGEAVNFDGPDSDPVRRFFLDNALFWIAEYHVDGLRLDAVHGIFDFGARHFLAELSAEVHALGERLGRQVQVIAESDLNDVRLLEPAQRGGFALDAQWSDDFHHALHAVMTGSRRGYFGDFGSLGDLAKAIQEGFVYDGRFSPYRRRRHGSSSRERPGSQHVVCLQNHDQVANGDHGERLASLLTTEQVKLAATVLLTTPNLPMLFQGEEYAELAPFFYFTSHGDPALAEAVRAGRRAEMTAFGFPPESFADPQAEETFAASRLQWERLQRPPHQAVHRLYRDLLALRARTPALRCDRKDLTGAIASESPPWLVVERGSPGEAPVLVVCNFSAEALPIPLMPPPASRRWHPLLWSGDPAYGGDGAHRSPSPSGESVRLEAWHGLILSAEPC